MKITNVDVLMLSGPGRQSQYGAPTGTLIRVDTDEGITGWGETDSHPAMVKAVVESEHHDEFMSGLGALIIGQDPRDTEAIWRRMARGTFNVGRDGLTVAAMAAIDLALWDIRGKASGLPVCDVLGGAKRKSFPFYGTYPLGDTLEQTRSNARELKRLDLPAVKLGWRPFGAGDASDDEAIVRALRDELGDDIELLIDGGLAFDVKTAIERSHMLADYGVYWFEEPLHPYDFAGYRQLTNKSAVPIAAGEMAMTRTEHARLIEGECLNVLQIDITRVGITTLVDVAALAEQHGIACVNHTFSLDWNLAASLHAFSTLDRIDLLEVQATPNEIRDTLAAERPQILNGEICLPIGPGLGVEPDQEALRRFLVEA